MPTLKGRQAGESTKAEQKLCPIRILKTKSLEISGEPLDYQVIFSDTEPEFDNDDEKYILKIILQSLGEIELE